MAKLSAREQIHKAVSEHGWRVVAQAADREMYDCPTDDSIILLVYYTQAKSSVSTGWLNKHGESIATAEHRGKLSLVLGWLTKYGNK